MPQGLQQLGRSSKSNGGEDGIIGRDGGDGKRETEAVIPVALCLR